MRVLAVDTTTGSPSAAVVEDGRLRGETGVEGFGRQSTRLLASIDVLIAALGLSAADMDGFAVTTGPGSFTGIRIGLSTVQSFAFAAGRQIAPVSSLRALAWKLRDDGAARVVPVLDAKKGEVYAAVFELGRGRMKESVRQGAYTPERFLSLLPKGRNLVFIGSGLAVVGEALRARLKDRARFSPRSTFIAAEVALLGAEILRAGKGVVPEELEPLYLRRSQAEEAR
jgi:tRNA threonylcarbamoyladenosine biosynthesis protein TsaB